MRHITLAVIAAALSLSSFTAVAANEDIVAQVLTSYKPGVTGMGPFTVEKVSVNDKARTISVKACDNVCYLPLTEVSLTALKADIAKALGYDGTKYKVTITAAGKSLDNLALFAPKKNVGPTERLPFITKVGAPQAPKGLDGANIALWQSHGWYFEPKLNRWEWQRARIFQTVEDLYTQSYVMPFLMPMLENAGAYVMSPRERDTNRTEIIIDNDGAFAHNGYAEEANGHTHWMQAPLPGFAYTTPELHNGDNPFRAGTARMANTSKSIISTATWSANVPQDGNYAVYVSYVTLPNSTTAAHYRVNAADGPHDFIINQTMGGGTWIYLGHFPLNAGEQTIVELTNEGKGAAHVVTADAVKIGGGMGNVARIVKEPLDDIDYKYVRSNYPRFVEGARYFLQWAGAPDSVYTESGNVNDYNDDYRSRGLWVNWLAGGSSMLPDRKGLNIPVDLSFAFHSDAGTTLNDSIIGTLGIYSTKGNTLGNGSSRLASRDLTDLVLTNIVGDVRAQYEPRWTRRGMWDQSYYEARVPEVPAMLLELLSHQNFADMKYGLDPTFRFTVSRAIYKGMLQFIAHRDGREYVVQPLPVHAFAIAKQPQGYRLSWSATTDSLEASAAPTYYIVEERIGRGQFRRIATVTAPEYDVAVTDTDIHSFRIIAANDGGVSFPSEVLALCHRPDDNAPVVIVNGFTRISAPDWWEQDTIIGGFYDEKDHGVPYVSDISYIGSQFEYRRNIPWMDDDAAGFGASRANYEDKVIAGNTFDYVITHGEAIAAAGHGFISASAESFANGSWAAVPDNKIYTTLDLILGKQKEIRRGRGAYGSYYKAFPADLQQQLRAYTSAGGNVLVTGAFIATDIWDNPVSTPEVAEADKKFATEVLGYHWRVGQASVTGQAYQVASRYRDFSDEGSYDFSNTLNDQCYAVESPDSFYPADPKRAATFMRYTENNLIAGILYNAGGYRTVAIGFPFETIACEQQRCALMAQVLKFFNNK